MKKRLPMGSRSLENEILLIPLGAVDIDKFKDEVRRIYRALGDLRERNITREEFAEALEDLHQYKPRSRYTPEQAQA
ncbi:hypothetical protein HYX14_04215 [Candidatus Woesearchaeota archaeon]|nr:hypothetical protein [Candidatus Woesearchaeota archaeon]